MCLSKTNIKLDSLHPQKLEETSTDGFGPNLLGECWTRVPSHVLTHSLTAGLHSPDSIKLPEIRQFSIMSGLDRATGAGVNAGSHHRPSFYW